MMNGAGRRTGDTVHIPGDYQFRALTEGHAVQRFWHAAKHLAIDEFLPPRPGDKVVDVGCGSGVISGHLASLGAKVVGIDANKDAIAFACSQYGAGNATFLHAVVDESLPVNEPVDKIYCLELIEHIYRPQALKMLTIFKQALAPGGKVLLTTPNYRSLWPVIEYLMDISGRFPELSGPQHVERYTAGKLKELSREAGFKVGTLTSFCFLSPWLAPLCWPLAGKLHALETRLPFRAGAILLAVLEKE